jgi:cellulose synthase/poly-beta-1,6-N-acetylglucosamine synthase-like glycosyltransferase
VKPFFEKERKGKASAINQILANARKEVIVFISADTLPSKGVFSKLTSKLEAPKVGVVSGNPIPVNSSKSLVGRVVKLMWRFHGHVFEELNDAGLARHATEAFCIRNGIVNRIPSETVNDDAYIALTAKKKGWLVKYSAESTISICGPRSYLEYFQQRRRVIYGHYQLRKLTGESPQYLVHMMPLHPLQVARLARWLLREYDLLTLGTFLLTEFLVNATAIADIAFGKPHVQWTTLPSTKVVMSQL